jgi:cysteine-rich repeat protein
MGGYYVNVHTAANPGGEIRGQLGFLAPADGDGCSADCRSDETCGNGVIDAGEECDDGDLDDGDGCDSSCMFEACSFFGAGTLGTRNFSIDQTVGTLFNSLVGLGTPVGTVGFTSGDLALDASGTDPSGNATVTLASDVVVGLQVTLGGFTQCIKFEALGTLGTLHCCGGHATGMSFTRDSNRGGTGGNGPAVQLAGIGTGERGDLEMAFRVRLGNAPLATPGDCATAAYGAAFTQFWTSGTAAGRVVRSEPSGGLLEFIGAGQAFDCSAWTTTDDVGALANADTALNAVPGVDAANVRVLDDQGGD